MNTADEREFFRLAAVWLGCRLDGMKPAADPLWVLLGEMDYHAEMILLCREVRGRRSPRAIVVTSCSIG